MKKVASKPIPKVYKTTITLEIVHVGKFKSHNLALLQGANVVAYLGDVKSSDSVEPEIIAMQNSSEELSVRDAKDHLGQFWEE